MQTLGHKIILCAGIAALLTGCSDGKNLDQILLEPALASTKWVKKDYNFYKKYGAQMAKFEGQFDSLTDQVGEGSAESLSQPRTDSMRKIATFAQAYGLIGLEKDPTKGAQLMEEYVRDRPDTRIMWNDLAMLYRDGNGVSQTHKRAAEYLKRGVLNTSEARFNMATAHYFGYGVRQDAIEAYKWLEIAASCTSNIAPGLDRAVRARTLLAERLPQRYIDQAKSRANLWMRRNNVSYNDWFCQPGKPGHVRFNAVRSDL